MLLAVRGELVAETRAAVLGHDLLAVAEDGDPERVVVDPDGRALLRLLPPEPHAGQRDRERGEDGQSAHTSAHPTSRSASTAPGSTGRRRSASSRSVAESASRRRGSSSS